MPFAVCHALRLGPCMLFYNHDMGWNICTTFEGLQVIFFDWFFARQWQDHAAQSNSQGHWDFIYCNAALSFYLFMTSFHFSTWTRLTDRNDWEVHALHQLRSLEHWLTSRSEQSPNSKINQKHTYTGVSRKAHCCHWEWVRWGQTLYTQKEKVLFLCEDFGCKMVVKSLRWLIKSYFTALLK